MWTRVTIYFVVGIPILTIGSVSVSLRIVNVPSIAESNLHKIFDKNEWLLMPEESIVKKFYDSLHSVGGQLHAKRKISWLFCMPSYHDLPLSFLNWIILGDEFFIYINLCLCPNLISKRGWSSVKMSFRQMRDLSSPFIVIHSTNSHYSKAIFSLNSYNAGRKLADLEDSLLW